MYQAAAGIFALALLPALGFVPFYLHLLSTVADRYLYLALLGPSLAVAYAARFAKLVPHLRLSLTVAYAAFLIFCAATTVRTVSHWRDTETLYRYTLTVNPKSVNATIALGDALERKGDPDAAAEVFARAIDYAPTVAEGYFDLGSITLFRGDPKASVPLLRKAVQLFPTGPAAHRSLALALELQGNWPEAVAELETAVRLQPDYAAARADLEEARRHAAQSPLLPLPRRPPEQNGEASAANQAGIAFAAQGNDDAAILAFRRALGVRPDYAEPFLHLGDVYARQGNRADARRSYRSVLLRKPNHAAALSRLAAVLP